MTDPGPSGNDGTGRRYAGNRGGARIILACSISLGLITFLTGLGGLGPWCLLTPDSIDYLTTARTLFETGHYPPVHMMPPPGFSTAIAPLMALGDMPVLGLRIGFSLCWVATSVLSFFLCRRGLGDRVAWIVGLLVAINTVLLMQSTMVLSEMVFLPLSLGALLATAGWGRGSASGWRAIVLSGLLAAAAVMVRSVGVVLLFAPVMLLLRDDSRRPLRRMTRAMFFLVCASAPLVAWEVRQSSFPAVAGYGRTWTTAREAEQTGASGLALQVERLARFGPMRLAEIKAAILPARLGWRVFQEPLDRATTWLVGGIFLTISLARVIREGSPTDVYLLLFLLMLALWPWDEGVRLVVPLIPLLIGNALWAAQRWWRRAGVRRWARRMLAAALALFVVALAAEMGLAQSRMADHRAKATRRLDQMRALAARMGQVLPAGSELMCITPNENNSKTILAGAAYLARMPIQQSLDVHGGSLEIQATPGRLYTFVYKTLVAQVARQWNAAPRFAVGDFSVFSPPADLATRDELPELDSD